MLRAGRGGESGAGTWAEQGGLGGRWGEGRASLQEEPSGGCLGLPLLPRHSAMAQRSGKGGAVL